MCAPRYSTQISVYTNATHWYDTEELLLLLLASSLSISWSWVIHREKMTSAYFTEWHMVDDLPAMIFSTVGPAVITGAHFSNEDRFFSIHALFASIVPRIPS